MSDTLSNTLLGFGLFALVTAIVGGGLEAFGFKLGPLKSKSRQTTLAAVGLSLILLVILSDNWRAIVSALNPVHFITETDGPTTLEPGQVHNIPLSLSQSGPVEVTIQTFIPDWDSFSGQRGMPGQDGLWVTICAAKSDGPCPSEQIGVSQPFSQELPAGSGTVRVFNFATNPRITFTLRVRHPA